MSEQPYRYIGPRPGSSYRQYFVNGTRTRAETIARYLAGPEAMTPEQVASECGLTVEAVLECVRYCDVHADLLREERTADWEDMAARGLVLEPAVSVHSGA